MIIKAKALAYQSIFSSFSESYFVCLAHAAEARLSLNGLEAAKTHTKEDILSTSTSSAKSSSEVFGDGERCNLLRLLRRRGEGELLSLPDSNARRELTGLLVGSPESSLLDMSSLSSCSLSESVKRILRFFRMWTAEDGCSSSGGLLITPVRISRTSGSPLLESSSLSTILRRVFEDNGGGCFSKGVNDMPKSVICFRFLGRLLGYMVLNGRGMVIVTMSHTLFWPIHEPNQR